VNTEPSQPPVPEPKVPAAGPRTKAEQPDSPAGKPAGNSTNRTAGKPAGESANRTADRPAAPPADPIAQAREISLRLLTTRPRTRSELHEALLRKKIPAEAAEAVLGRLNEVGLVDDASFAEQWVRSRHTYQGMARRALAAELRRKGVADPVAAEAVAAVDSESEESRARELVRKRLRALTTADELTKIRRLVAMLARKGYPEGMSYRVVREELRTAGTDTTLLDTPNPD